MAITFYPALSSVHSVTAGSTVRFLAYVYGDVDADIQVWTNLTGNWREHTFERRQGLDGVLVAELALTELSGGAASETSDFTYRIHHRDGSIQWLSQAAGQDNGRIIVVTGPSSSPSTSSDDGSDVGSFLEGIDPTFRVEDVSGDTFKSQSTGENGSIEVQLQSTPLPAGQADDIAKFSLGIPSEVTAGLVLERTKPTWFTPRLIKGSFEISSEHDCQLLALQRTGGRMAVVLPVTTDLCMAVLRGSEDGSGALWLRTERNSDEEGRAYVVIGRGPQHQLYELVDACVQLARLAILEQTKGKAREHEVVSETSGNLNLASEQPASPALNRKLGFCTWNSLGPDYRLSGVLGRLEQFAKDDSLECFDTLLLDDGWQEVRMIDRDERQLRGLVSFNAGKGWVDVEDTASADCAKSGQLGRAVAIIRNRFPSIQYIGIWLTLQGYWHGIHPDSNLAKKYKLEKVVLRPAFWSEKSEILLPCNEEQERFWRDYLGHLREAGVDFVKIDNQAELDRVVGQEASKLRMSAGRTARKVAAEVFGSDRCVNCMAHSPRVYSDLMRGERDHAVAFRTSDDFFPDEDESHRYHIAFNATCSLLHNALPILPDFDMFQTSHKLWDYHAQLRALSVCQLYATDDGSLSTKCLDKLGGRNRAGHFAVVQARAQQAATRLSSNVFEDVLGDGDGPILKLGLTDGMSGGGGIIGLWNCRGKGARGTDVLLRCDVAQIIGPAPRSPTEYQLLLCNPDGTFTDLSTVTIDAKDSYRQGLDSDPIAALRLAEQSCARVVVSPLRRLGEHKLALLGLIDKYAGLSALLSIEDGAANSSPEAAPSGSTPAETSKLTLPQLSSNTKSGAQATNAGRGRARGSRLLALILLFRGDLADMRHSFWREFWSAPLRTVYRELRAAFGGTSTLPILSPGAAVAHPDSGTAPAGQIDRGQSEFSGEDGGTIDSDGADDSSEELLIQISVTGKLGWTLLEGQATDLLVELEGRPVRAESIRRDGNLYVLDMDQEATAILAEAEQEKRRTQTWQVTLRSRSRSRAE